MAQTEAEPGILAGLQRGLNQLEYGLLTMLLIGLVLLGLGQILLRNLFDLSLPWADGAMRAMVLWLTMIAAGVAAGRYKHIHISVADRWLPERLQKWLHRLICLATAGLCLGMSWLSLRMIELEIQFRTVAFLNLPNWLVLIIIPIGFAMMSARFAARAFVVYAAEQPPPEDDVPR